MLTCPRGLGHGALSLIKMNHVHLESAFRKMTFSIDSLLSLLENVRRNGHP